MFGRIKLTLPCDTGTIVYVKSEFLKRIGEKSYFSHCNVEEGKVLEFVYGGDRKLTATIKIDDVTYYGLEYLKDYYISKDNAMRAREKHGK